MKEYETIKKPSEYDLFIVIIMLELMGLSLIFPEKVTLIFWVQYKTTSSAFCCITPTRNS